MLLHISFRQCLRCLKYTSIVPNNICRFYRLIRAQMRKETLAHAALQSCRSLVTGMQDIPGTPESSGPDI